MLVTGTSTSSTTPRAANTRFDDLREGPVVTFEGRQGPKCPRGVHLKVVYMSAERSEALKALYEKLQRYAGWLDRERMSVIVRADVEALGAAINTCADPWPPLDALDTNIARLPSGAMRKMLRVTASDMRRALAESR